MPERAPQPLGIETVEVRVLDGPNLYFPGPAIKVVLRVPALLALRRREALAVARRLGLRRAEPGRRGTTERQQFAGRVVRGAVRRVGQAAGLRRLATRVRPGSSLDEVVIAFPWRHRERGVASGEAVERTLRALLSDDPQVAERAVEDSAAWVAARGLGEAPTTITPTIPVASITGTNGKTTTTRLVAHIAMTAGLRTGWSSTSGVLVQGEVVREGDYSGPGGARAVLESPGVQIGILETARGGMLLRGMGVRHNDVSVVTNVTADHLGLQGIDTVDQLAEVKAIVTKVTRPTGWTVLNGDDPRVWAMRAGTRGRLCAFSLDSSAPALRGALDAGGRAVTVLDDAVAVLEPDGTVHRLVALTDVPMTLAGLSRHNTANALAGAAAALGLGLPRQAVVDGLRTFAPDGAHNPGRMNVYSVPPAATDSAAATVILDMAHNEDGLRALLDVARGLTAPGGRLHLGLGTGGDRTDDILANLGAMAGAEADVIHLVHKDHYLRDRTREDLESHLRRGLSRSGVGEAEVYPDEPTALAAVLPQLHDGDVLALMTHESWAELDGWLTGHGGSPDSAATVRRKVKRARGEHEDEELLAGLRAEAATDPGGVRERLATLVEAAPADPRLVYELALVTELAGDPSTAATLYARARELGLAEPLRREAVLHQGALALLAGDPQQALGLVDEIDARWSGEASVVAYRALARQGVGDASGAVADLVEALLQRAAGSQDDAFRADLHAAVAALRR